MNNVGLPNGPQVGAKATAGLPISALSRPRYIFAASVVIFGIIGTFVWTIFLCWCLVDLISVVQAERAEINLLRRTGDRHGLTRAKFLEDDRSAWATFPSPAHELK